MRKRALEIWEQLVLCNTIKISLLEQVNRLRDSECQSQTEEHPPDRRRPGSTQIV